MGVLGGGELKKWIGMIVCEVIKSINSNLILQQIDGVFNLDFDRLIICKFISEKGRGFAKVLLILYLELLDKIHGYFVNTYKVKTKI